MCVCVCVCICEMYMYVNKVCLLMKVVNKFKQIIIKYQMLQVFI